MLICCVCCLLSGFDRKVLCSLLIHVFEISRISQHMLFENGMCQRVPLLCETSRPQQIRNDCYCCTCSLIEIVAQRINSYNLLLCHCLKEIYFRKGWGGVDLLLATSKHWMNNTCIFPPDFPHLSQLDYSEYTYRSSYRAPSSFSK